MILGHMSPSSTAQHISHAGGANAIFPSKICPADITIGVSSPYVNDLLIGEFCVRVIFTPPVAFLGYFIRHVVGSRAQEMMRWVTAGRIEVTMIGSGFVEFQTLVINPGSMIDKADKV